MRRTFMVWIIWVWLAGVLAAAAADHRLYKFEEGNQSYQSGDYQGAVSAYEEVVAMGYGSPALYYNLGNAYYKLGMTGRAILNYERGLRLQANDEDIRFNLQIANLEVVDKIPVIPELFVTRILRDFRDRFDIATITAFFVVIYGIFVTLLIAWILTRGYERRRRLRRAALSFGFLFVLTLGLFIHKIVDVNANIKAIVMPAEVDVRSAPDPAATELFKIHEGLKISVTQQRGEWSQIRLSDGKLGWLPVDAIEII